MIIFQLIRNSFVKILETEIDRSRRYDIAMTVCVMEFKTKAGQAGSDYQETEQALRALCDFFLANIRKSDILSRIDLHRIALLMPQTALAEAEAICSRLVRLVSPNPADEQLQLSITYGLDQRSAQGEDSAEDLLDRAAAALQTAQN